MTQERPTVCFAETSTQLLAETRAPMPPRPGRPQRQDYVYRRQGSRNLLLACEPLAGWRQVAVTQRRTMQDFAQARCAGCRMKLSGRPSGTSGPGQPDRPPHGVAVRDLRRRWRPGGLRNGWSSTARLLARQGGGTCLKLQRILDHETHEREVQALVRLNATPLKPSSTGGSTPRKPEPKLVTAFILSIPRLTEY